MTVYVLGADKKVLTVTGDPKVTSTDGVNWATHTEQAVKTTAGVSLCLNQLESVILPSRNAPNKALVGVGCDGKLYVRTSAGWASLRR